MTTPEQAASTARFTDNLTVHAATELAEQLGAPSPELGGFVLLADLPTPVPMGDPIPDVTASHHVVAGGPTTENRE